MNVIRTREFWAAIRRRLRFVSLPEFDYNIHISLRHQLLYVETPKVACSTLKLTLARMELEDTTYNREDIHDRNLSPLLKPSQVGDFAKFLQRPGLVKFCFVRDPYERLLSAYLNKVSPQSGGVYLSLLGQLGLDQSDFQQRIDFSSFVQAVEQTPVYWMNSHWRPQYYQTYQESLDFDFIGRLERFDEDLREVGRMASVDMSAYLETWDRHRTNSAGLLKEYYTPSLRKRVHRIYEIDFDHFGYAKEF